MDFLKPPAAVDGVGIVVLAVRDLASGRQLLWQAFTEETAAVVCGALEQLFRQHGPPLVMKCDNGSPFIAEVTCVVHVQWRVSVLFSPPRMPRYNGACERGNGMLRTFTDELAVQEGRRGVWLTSDLERACQLNNEVHRPERLNGKTPIEVWNERPVISEEERRAFLAAVEAGRQSVLSHWQKSFTELSRDGRAALDRIAVPEVLSERGYLTIRRRKQRDRALYLTLTRQPGATETPASSPSNETTNSRSDATPSAASAEPSQTARPVPVRRTPRPATARAILPELVEKNSHLSRAAAKISMGPSSSGAATAAADSPAEDTKCPGLFQRLRRLIALVINRWKAAHIP